MIIRRLLIANRGEIASRIIRTCRRLGIETVLAASETDLDSVPARLADRTVCIGGGRPSESYLNLQNIITAAERAHVDAIHPGYGFLSENAAFAQSCRNHDIIFIGPGETQLASVGDKLRARLHAKAAGLPLLPGGAVESVQQARRLAEQIGWPVLIKAVSGGGGRGMKQVHTSSDLEHALELAVAEAHSAFGDCRVYVERFIARGRHVEVQLLGDGERVIHLGDRDCSVQRRYQKLIEEAPAPGLPEKLRSSLHRAAVSFGAHLRYRGLGTVEFLVDAARAEFYFLEMNARIQVEHPVTEAITGLDLVAEQIAVAEGRPLRLRQSDVALSGHAIECRINAEDPALDFRPAPGTINRAIFPAGAGIRVDTHIEAGSRVPPYYDSLLAKLIAHGIDRKDCLRTLHTALGNCDISGVSTNLSFHRRFTAHPNFVRGSVNLADLASWMEAQPMISVRSTAIPGSVVGERIPGLSVDETR